MNSTKRKAATNKAALAGCCEPCAEMPAGTVFFCEDGVFTPVPQPQGMGPWALCVSPNVGGGMPYWESWVTVVAGGSGPTPVPPPVPPDEPHPWETVK